MAVSRAVLVVQAASEVLGVERREMRQLSVSTCRQQAGSSGQNRPQTSGTRAA